MPDVAETSSPKTTSFPAPPILVCHCRLFPMLDEFTIITAGESVIRSAFAFVDEDFPWRSRIVIILLDCCWYTAPLTDVSYAVKQSL